MKKILFAISLLISGLVSAQSSGYPWAPGVPLTSAALNAAFNARATYTSGPLVKNGILLGNGFGDIIPLGSYGMPGQVLTASGTSGASPSWSSVPTILGTNITGTASGLNIGGSAGSVTTNANLTGVITSVGNATSIASQTGTGTKFVVDTSPTLVTPVIGAATGTSLSVTGSLTSTVATGTAPLVVSSTTNVPNLNVSLLNGVSYNSSPSTNTVPVVTGANTTTYTNDLSLLSATSNSGGTTTGRTLAAHFGDTYNLKDYGAICDGAHATADTTALTNVMAAMQTNSLLRGGILFIPKGHCNFNNEMAWTAYAAELLHNIYIVGEGPINTVLDFSAVSGSGNGISFNAGGHFGVSDLEIYGAPGNCVYVGKGNSGSSYSLQGSFKNLRLQGCGINGWRETNTYEMTVSQIWSRNNIVNGFLWDGFHTSLNETGLTADNNAYGFVGNGITYSNFGSMAADSNTNQGYVFSNITATAMNGVGGEQNGKDCFEVLTSNASSVGIPTGSQDVHGLTINGLACYLNSAAGAGSYASMMLLNSGNGRPIDVAINGAIGTPNTVSDVPFIFASTSGAITLKRDFVDTSQFTAADFYSLSGGGTAKVNNMATNGAVSLGSSLSLVGQLTSTVSTGTAPFVVASTTQVANLNAATAGSATTATTSTNATNLTTTDDTATNTTYYPTFQTATGGTNPLKTSSTKLTYNPSTGLLSTTGVTLTGTTTFGDGATWGTGGITDTTTYTTSSLTGPINLAYTTNYTNTGGGQTGFILSPTLTSTGATAGNLSMISLNPSVGNSANNIANARGLILTGAINGSYSGTVTNFNVLQLTANSFGTNPITNLNRILLSGTSTNGNGITSGTVTNSFLNIAGDSSAAGSGGTVNNYGSNITLGTGSSAGTNNTGILITGNGGGASTNYAIDSSSTATSRFIGKLNVTSTASYAGNILYSTTAPTVASGFGSGASIPANNGTAAFTVNVGTGGSASSGVITMPIATTGWICQVTPNGAPQAAAVTYSAPTSTTSITLTNYTLTTGIALAWTASTVLDVHCTGY